MSRVRLGIVLDGPVSTDGVDHWTNLPMGRYCERVSRRFGKIDIYAPVLDPDELAHGQNAEFKLDREWASTVPLPWGGGSLWREIVRQRELVSLYRAGFRRNDWVIFLQPAGYRLAGIAVCVAQRRHYSLYFACEWEENAPFTYRWGEPSGPRYWAYLKFGQLAARLALARAKFALTAGKALEKSVSRSGIPTFTTSPRMNLTTRDIWVREDTCQGESISCLFVGALIPRKGLLYLLDAIGQLRAKGLPVVLRLAGEGVQRAILEERAETLGIGDSVEFLGHTKNGSELWALYRAADLFVLPTLAEGFPRVLYEAMSQSLPIVSSNVSGIPYTVQNRESGLLVEPEDASQLARAIEELINDAALRRKLIAEGLKTIRPILETDPGTQLIELMQAHAGIEVSEPRG